MYQSLVIKDDFHADTQTFFKGKRVAIAGGSGFIGSHLVEQLLKLQARPVVLSRQDNPRLLSHIRDSIEVKNCDLQDYQQVVNSIKDCPVVLNLAASVAGLEYNAKHPASIFQENLTTFFNVIKASQEAKVERFLVTSSACVYPRFCSIPTPEEEGVKDEPEPTNSGYGWSKRMEEYLGAKYAEEFGMSVAIARPYNAYGPRDNFNPKSSHVIPALIRKAFETQEDTFHVWGDGSHSRSFLYVDDFARGLVECAARYAEADPINIGADEEATIKETAQKIAEEVSIIRGRQIQPKFDPQGLTGQPRRKCDTTKAERVIGYQAKVKFDDGLKKTIHWFAEHQKDLS